MVSFMSGGAGFLPPTVVWCVGHCKTFRERCTPLVADKTLGGIFFVEGSMHCIFPYTWQFFVTFLGCFFLWPFSMVEWPPTRGWKGHGLNHLAFGWFWYIFNVNYGKCRYICHTWILNSEEVVFGSPWFPILRPYIGHRFSSLESFPGHMTRCLL